MVLSKVTGNRLFINFLWNHSWKLKDNWFFKNSLVPLIKQYSPDHLKAIVPSVLTQSCPYVLNMMWVNFQNKYEFYLIEVVNEVLKQMKSNSPCEYSFTNINLITPQGQKPEAFYQHPHARLWHRKKN